MNRPSRVRAVKPTKAWAYVSNGKIIGPLFWSERKFHGPKLQDKCIPVTITPAAPRRRKPRRSSK